jgi:hypothetical protein
MTGNFKLLFIIGLMGILMLAGCAAQEEEYEPNVGASCTQQSECKLPMEYAIQSNCPFGVSCIDFTCKVVCPLYYHDPDMQVSKGYSFTCEVDSDCDCSERGNRTIECRCVENKCLSVEAE